MRQCSDALGPRKNLHGGASQIIVEQEKALAKLGARTTKIVQKADTQGTLGNGRIGHSDSLIISMIKYRVMG